METFALTEIALSTHDAGNITIAVTVTVISEHPQKNRTSCWRRGAPPRPGLSATTLSIHMPSVHARTVSVLGDRVVPH